MERSFRRYFIYSRKTNKCLSNKLYMDNYLGHEALNKDRDMLEKLIPHISIGEAWFDKATRRLIEQFPVNVICVKYPEDAAAEVFLNEKRHQTS